MSDDHVLANRESWDADAENWVERGREAWSAEEITWGIWSVPERTVHLLPDVDGIDVVELGCGTGYLSAWLARRGARPVGLDNSGRQLATAAAFQEEFGVRFPLVHADAERAPFRDASFDLAVSEYGAAIWCDPYRWILEAARLLRPGGALVFLGHSYLSMLTFPEADDAPASETLQRPHFGMHRFEWEDGDGSIEFAIPHGDMVRLLRASDLDVEISWSCAPPTMRSRPKGTCWPRPSGRDGGRSKRSGWRGSADRSAQLARSSTTTGSCGFPRSSPRTRRTADARRPAGRRACRVGGLPGAPWPARGSCPFRPRSWRPVPPRG